MNTVYLYRCYVLAALFLEVKIISDAEDLYFTERRYHDTDDDLY